MKPGSGKTHDQRRKRGILTIGQINKIFLKQNPLIARRSCPSLFCGECFMLGRKHFGSWNGATFQLHLNALYRRIYSFRFLIEASCITFIKWGGWLYTNFLGISLFSVVVSHDCVDIYHVWFTSHASRAPFLWGNIKVRRLRASMWRSQTRGNC